MQNRSRRMRNRSAIAALLVLSMVATAGAGLAAGPWPDGEWWGYISGGGVGSGTFTEDSGSSRFAEGTAVAGGFFTLLIVDGEPKGEYGITWNGSGSASGRTGSTSINELGIVDGSDGIPRLVRQSASGSSTSEGETIPFAVPRLAPAPTPLLGDYADCQMVEGSFEGKLAGLAAAFREFGFKVATQETFTAFRVIDGSPEAKAARTAQLERLAEITNAFGFILAIIDEIGLGQAIVDAEALLDEAEEILAALDAVPECDGVNTEGFSLGVSKALEFFVDALLQEALDQGDAKAIARLSGLAGRAGILPAVNEFGAEITALAVAVASGEKDLVKLDWLLVAAFTFGDIELFELIVREIAEIGGKP